MNDALVPFACVHRATRWNARSRSHRSVTECSLPRRCRRAARCTGLPPCDTTVAAFALLRVGALLLGGYLLVVLVVAGALRTVDERGSSLVLDRLTLGLARGLFGAIGLGTFATTLAPAAGAQAAPSTVAAIREIDPPTAPTPVPAVIRALPDETAPTIPATIAPTSTPANEQYVVVAGESLWSIAAARMSEATGRTDLRDSEIVPYWRALVDAAALPNPNLLFVGQVIELPAVDA